MDLDVNMRTVDCFYTVTFYGALFREVGPWGAGPGAGAQPGPGRGRGDMPASPQAGSELAGGPGAWRCPGGAAPSLLRRLSRVGAGGGRLAEEGPVCQAQSWDELWGGGGAGVGLRQEGSAGPGHGAELAQAGPRSPHWRDTVLLSGACRGIRGQMGERRGDSGGGGLPCGASRVGKPRGEGEELGGWGIRKG